MHLIFKMVDSKQSGPLVAIFGVCYVLFHQMYHQNAKKTVLLYSDISKCKNQKCKDFLINFLHELGNFKQKNFTFKNAIVFTFYSTGPQIPKNGRLKPTQSLKNWGSNITIPFTITLITNEVLWKKNEQRKTFCGDVLFQIILVKEYGNFHQEPSLRFN